MADALTPAEHRAKAEAAMRTMGTLAPREAAYHGLALSALAHILAAVAEYLEPPPQAQIPGLPPGYQLETFQAPAGERKWAFALTGPDGQKIIFTQYRWAASETALAEGIRYAARHQSITAAKRGIAS